MAIGLEQLTKEAMDLPARQKLALAEFLIESADSAVDPDAESAWDSEIQERIRWIDEGKVQGVPFDEVLRNADARLIP